MLDFQHSKYPYLVSNANQIELLSIAETYEKKFLNFFCYFLQGLVNKFPRAVFKDPKL